SLSPIYLTFLFSSYGDHRDLHSFPTRRSSDLRTVSGVTLRNVRRILRVFHTQRASMAARIALRHSGPAEDVRASSIPASTADERSEEHTSELQSLAYLVCRLLLEKKK